MTNRLLKTSKMIIKMAWFHDYIKNEIMKVAAMPKAIEDKVKSLNRTDPDIEKIKNFLDSAEPKYFAKAIAILSETPQISFTEFSYKLFGSVRKEKSEQKSIYDSLVEKHPEHKSTFDYFVSSTPGTKKYLAWQAKMFLIGQAPPRELVDIVNMFHKYGDKLDKKDINQYGPEEVAILRDKLSFLDGKKQENLLKEEGIACGNNEIYRSNTCVVKHIFNRDASIHYGKDTRWCISGGLSKNYFNDYDSNNVVFFFVLSKFPKPNNKIAVIYKRDKANAIEECQIFDSEDILLDDFPDCFSTEEIVTILNLTRKTAESHPKSIVAKLQSQEASTEEILQLYADVKNHEDKEYKTQVLELIARNPSTPLEILSELFKIDHLKQFVGENPNLSLDLLTQIASNTEDTRSAANMRSAAAANPNTPADLLWELFNQSIRAASTNNVNFDHRLSLTKNPNVPFELLMELANDQDWIKKEIAHNPNTYPEILDKLSNDYNFSVMIYVANNPNVPSETLDKMLKNSDIRRSLAEGSTSKTVLEKLFKYDSDLKLKTILARNRKTPSEILVQLSQDENWDVRAGVAINTSTPIPILEQLSIDVDSTVRQSVARNNKTPVEVLQRLLDDTDREVIAEAIYNPSLPIETLKTLIGHPDEKVREAVVRSGRATEQMLKQLENDSSEEVRFWVERKKWDF